MRLKSRREALRDLGLVIADIFEATVELTPREAAVRAWHEDHPMTLDELEREIDAMRAG